MMLGGSQWFLLGNIDEKQCAYFSRMKVLTEQDHATLVESIKRGKTRALIEAINES